MFIEHLNQEPRILLALSVILLAGCLLARLAKYMRLPKVSAYLLAGILIGPHLLNIIPGCVADGLCFVCDIALAFIAFGVGQFFEKETLRKTGFSVVAITLFESLTAGILVTAAMFFILGLHFNLALLLGAIATATAPASTVMTINQYHARGGFVDKLLQIVALDDVICLLVFSAAAAVIDSLEYGAFSPAKALLPVLLNLLAVGGGGLSGLLLHRLLLPRRSEGSRLIIAVAFLLGLSGLCAVLDVSPLLACMVFGAVYINKSRDARLFDQLNSFTPPVMLLFFVESGMNLDLGILPSFGVAGAAYFLIRVIGKYMGAYAGCRVVKADKNIQDYLGMALIPQAGVAIGLAYLARRILPEQIGSLLMTIILASSVLYELIGPVCVKIALTRSGAIQEEG